MEQTSNKRTYDLEERTAAFGERVITLCRSLKKDVITSPLANQPIRSATSIGANYMEANGASSKKDFTNKIFICKKESRETKHWLRMLGTALPEEKDKMRKLWQECQELTLIFQKIASSTRSKIEP
jgi:four helix bundle protein